VVSLKGQFWDLFCLLYIYVKDLPETVESFLLMILNYFKVSLVIYIDIVYQVLHLTVMLLMVPFVVLRLRRIWELWLTRTSKLLLKPIIF